jgi:hypothetical protein
MTIHRGKIPPEAYPGLAESATCDAQLSFKARGLLLTILAALSGDTTRALTVTGLARTSMDGPNAVRTGLNELVSVGYLGRGRQQGEPSKIHYHVTVPAGTAANGDIARSAPAGGVT